MHHLNCSKHSHYLIARHEELGYKDKLLVYPDGLDEEERRVVRKVCNINMCSAFLNRTSP